jgi:acyl carrier protein
MRTNESVRLLLEETIGSLLGGADLELRDDTRLEDLPNWDSLVRVNLMFAAEQKFGLEFSGDQIFDFNTFGELVEHVQARSRRPAAAGS